MKVNAWPFCELPLIRDDQTIRHTANDDQLTNDNDLNSNDLNSEPVILRRG